MKKIHVLSENVINKIAAGEVIERPASIVKELVENSLDAQATSVEVEIKHGGRSYIRVADNGIGMQAGDAELSFQRHATSKIEDADDLNSVASFGFRGEALASISAVSRMSLQTRARGTDAGTEVVIEGGKKISVKPTPCREGTIMEVRDLFFNTPARRKFLRTDPTELGHVTDALSNLALINFKVRFSLKSANRTIFDLAPAKTILERAQAIFGEEDAKYLLPIEGKGTDIRIYGVIGKPYLARGNRTDQTFFINNRWIRSIGLSYALQDGYHGLLMHGQYPAGVIAIEVNPERVDVNVHPTKQEVRISKESEVKSLIKRTVAEKLQGEGDIAPPLSYVPTSEPVTPYRSPATQPTSGTQADFSRHLITPSGPTPTLVSASIEETLEEPISFRDELHVTKVLGQIHNTFIVAETEEGMIIVDQHAAHERVMFEELMQEFNSEKPKKQQLLMDEVLELHARQEEVLENSRTFLEKLGFEIESFGDHSYVIRSCPAILSEENSVAWLKRYVEEKEAGKTRTRLDDAQEDVAAMIACKRKSVKAHDHVSSVGMKSLLQRLSKCENPFSCPHGRPTFFKHTFNDLEKQFKRK